MTEKINTRVGWKLFAGAFVFLLLIAPTIISYAPYLFRWDDADYLVRSLIVSRSFWSGDTHAMRIAMVEKSPPAMVLLAIPWGPISTWTAAGKCFITLIVITSIFAALCLYLLLRVGAKPLNLALAGAAVFVVIGPWSVLHFDATSFMADPLFAWIAFAVVLLIPYEQVSKDQRTSDAVLRGILWGAIFSAAAITKVTAGYFLLLVTPILFFFRVRTSGRRNALITLASLAATSLPVAIYWLRYGLDAFMQGWGSAFGKVAPLYYTPLRFFLHGFVGLWGLLAWTLCVIAGMACVLVLRRRSLLSARSLPLLIMLSFFAVAAMSPNREMRFFFPAIVSLPFLIALLLSRKEDGFSFRSAALAAGCVLCALVILSIPTLHRPDKQSITRAQAVLDQAIQSRTQGILLATDSASLNYYLMRVAIAVSSHPDIRGDGLGWGAPTGAPIEYDYRLIREADLVVFQDKEVIIKAPITNVRVPQYEEYVRQHSAGTPIKVVGDLRIFQINHDSH